VATSRFFGGGFEMFKGRTDAHSIYFEVLGEHGYVGLGLFLLLGLFTWMAASRIRRKTEGTPDMDWMATLARMVQVSLVAYATAGAFLGMAYFDYAYNLVLIVVLCKAILAGQRPGSQPVSAVRAREPRRMPGIASPASAPLRRSG
jgi:O-antigen ligase